MKTVLVTLRAFAFVLFLFIPAIAVMLFAGFVLHDSAWFIGLGLPALIVNGLVLFFEPIRGLVAKQFDALTRAARRS